MKFGIILVVWLGIWWAVFGTDVTHAVKEQCGKVQEEQREGKTNE